LTSGLIGSGTPQYQYAFDHASNLTSITANGPEQNYAYTSTNAITGAAYDSNGSPTSLAGASYKWDGENRLIQYSNLANNTGTSFSYDGLGRLIRVVDTHAGAITADRSFTWCGNTRCLAHDNTQSNSPVSTQYYDQGAIIAGTSYYYTKDRLGSVSQLIDTSGTIAAQYTYDPYGNITTVSGTLVSDIGYAGYYYHAVSGLNFAVHRAYDSTHARWLNRDPISEAGGINLYAYVRGNPITRIDPLGLADTITDKITSYIAQGNIQGLEDLIEAGGLDPAQQRIAQAGLQQIQILSRSTSSVSRLADAFRQSGKVVRRAIEQCKQAGLPKSGPIRNPDVVVDLTTGEVYPQLPGGGLGDSIGNLTDFLPKN
jgi:RHS repeat-associated protein